VDLTNRWTALKSLSGAANAEHILGIPAGTTVAIKQSLALQERISILIFRSLPFGAVPASVTKQLSGT